MLFLNVLYLSAANGVSIVSSFFVTMTSRVLISCVIFLSFVLNVFFLPFFSIPWVFRIRIILNLSPYFVYLAPFVS